MTEITTAERARRHADVERIIASAALEGGRVPNESRADLAEWAEGRIEADELVRRAHERFPVVGE